MKLIYNKNRVVLDRIVGVLLIILYWMFVIAVFATAYDIVKYVISVGKIPAGKSTSLPPGFPMDKIIAFVIVLVITSALKKKGGALLSRAKTFNDYFCILSVDPTYSIERLAASTDIPKVPFIKTGTADKIVFVQDCLINMIKSGYFPKGTHIDPNKKCLVFPGQIQVNTIAASSAYKEVTDKSGIPANIEAGAAAEYSSFTCKNCGASNRAVKGVESECAYCGTVVRID